MKSISVFIVGFFVVPKGIEFRENLTHVQFAE